MKINYLQMYFNTNALNYTIMVNGYKIKFVASLE